MIIDKEKLRPAATRVDAELVDADTQVMVLVEWGTVRHAEMFRLQGFDPGEARHRFQVWADRHAAEIAAALALREQRRAEAEAERLDERLDPALQREANSGH
jgi:hypothetical protein